MRAKNFRTIVASTLLVATFPAIALDQPTTPAVKPRSPAATAQAPAVQEYRIAPGDVIRVAVFQNPDLTLETRVAENGTISYPLIGSVPVGGNSVGEAQRRIAQMLHDGGFIVAPQVTITVVQVLGSQVTVLGQVTKPGRFPLDSTAYKLTDMLALAGGITPAGADTVVLTGLRDGKPMRMEIDIQHLGAIGDPVNQMPLQAGDMIYVNRAPNFYIYGEVQKPGAFRLERNMTVMQALATGGGLTPKGTQRGLTIHRRGPDGSIQVIEPKLDDPVLADDVIYIRQSIF